MTKIYSRHRKTLWILIVVLMTAFFGIMIGSRISNAQGTPGDLIYACVRDGIGIAKIVSPNETCPSDWSPIQWDIQGPSGNDGAAGPAGARGTNGAAGPAGPVGAEGATGAWGETGPMGAIGFTGPKGDTGAVGPAGPLGATGAIGLPGATGSAGATGATGPAGLSNLEVVRSQGIRDSFNKSLTVTCPSGKMALGGGGDLIGAATSVSLVTSVPVGFFGPFPTGWRVSARELISQSGEWRIDVYVVCGSTD